MMVDFLKERVIKRITPYDDSTRSSVSRYIKHSIQSTRVSGTDQADEEPTPLVQLTSGDDYDDQRGTIGHLLVNHVYGHCVTQEYTDEFNPITNDLLNSVSTSIKGFDDWTNFARTSGVVEILPSRWVTQTKIVGNQSFASQSRKSWESGITGEIVTCWTRERLPKSVIFMDGITKNYYEFGENIITPLSSSRPGNFIIFEKTNFTTQGDFFDDTGLSKNTLRTQPFTEQETLCVLTITGSFPSVTMTKSRLDSDQYATKIVVGGIELKPGTRVSYSNYNDWTNGRNTDMLNALLMMSSSTDDELESGYRSTTQGIQYDNSVHGIDSIAFGGLTYGKFETV